MSDPSCCNSVSISIETDFDPAEVKFLCLIPSPLQLEDFEFGLFSHISDLNINSCGSPDKQVQQICILTFY